MEKIKSGWFYIAVDGDGIGKLVGRAVIANDVDELHKVSNRIDAAQDLILHWCKDNGGIKISGGGDEATMAIPPEAKEEIKKLRESVEKSFGYTISVGVGRSLCEAGTALLVAKLRGKDRIVWFNKKIKEDIKKAKRRVREKRATPDEYKLSEAYLEKSESMLCNLHKQENHKKHLHDLHKHEEGFHDPQNEEGSHDECPYCADNEDNRTDDCAYCQDLDAEENADGTAGMHDCPACKEYDEADQIIGGVEGCPYCNETPVELGGDAGVDGCPYCENETIAEAEAGTPSEQGAEDHHICNCPDCPEKDETGLAVEDMAAQRPDDCPQCQEMYSDAVENEQGQTGQSDPNLQGHETAEEVLDMLDQEPGSNGQTPAQAAKKIDNTELPQGDQMKDGTSVKEDFGPAQKNDISDSEIDAQKDHDCDCPNCPKNQEDATANAAPDASDDGSSDEPDMAGILQDGLDDHADEQKKQQVLDMVAQTLQGFKANKASLEATKEQNQPLYNSCIQMLKSMIELCKLLGLQPQMPEQSAPSPTPAAPPSGLAQPAAAEGSEDPKAMG